MQHATSLKLIIRGALFGAIVGVPLSYFLQPGMLRAFTSITKYLSTLPEVFANAYKGGSEWDITATILFSMVATAAVGGVIGWVVHLISARNAASQSADS